MKRKHAFLLFFFALILLFMVWAQSGLRAAGRGTLTVRVNYTGLGPVDQQHQIYILLTDTDPFALSKRAHSTLPPTTPETGAARILACQSIPAKDGTVGFRNLASASVYAVAFLDRPGSYTRLHDSLPPGSPLGAYGKMPDRLDPIKVGDGKTGQIVLAFNDSRKTP